MDGSKVEFLRIGSLVRVQHWVGEIVDVAETAGGKIMIQVQSPKGIWRNHPAEWLEYIEGQIAPATPEEIKRSLIVYRGYITKMLGDIDALAARWGVELGSGDYQIVLDNGHPRIVNTKNVLAGSFTFEQAQAALAEFEGSTQKL